MKMSRWTLLGLLIIAVLAAIWVGVLTGYLTPGDIVGSFLGLVFALVVISILAIIGAVFLGMVISHRIMSGRGFTPFEEEMLKMRQEVRDLHDRIDAIAARLGAGPEPKDRGR